MFRREIGLGLRAGQLLFQLLAAQALLLQLLLQLLFSPLLNTLPGTNLGNLSVQTPGRAGHPEASRNQSRECHLGGIPERRSLSTEKSAQ